MLEKLEKMMKKKCFFFEEETFSSFKIASLPNWDGAKYAVGCHSSCFNWNQLGLFDEKILILTIFIKLCTFSQRDTN